MEWDVFISHAWEDKQSIALPLAKALESKGLAVWYDEFTLKIGDSLRRSIDHGLANSSYGIVILSPSFFSKEWPQKELDALVGREGQGSQVILPIWHGIDANGVRQFSPLLADRIAVSSSNGLDHVVDGILKVISKPSPDLKPKESEEEIVTPQSIQERGKSFLKSKAQETQGRPIVELKLTPGRTTVPVKKSAQLFYTLIEVSLKYDLESIINPLNVVLILDRGSSLAREQGLFVKQAVQNLIKLLGPEDKIAIITFGSGPEILVQAQAVKDREWLEQRVDRLGNVDNTLDLAVALDEGIDQALKFRSPDRITRIIVLTAAQFKSEGAILKIAERAGQENIPIIALGMGTDWDENNLVDVAQRSGGMADYVMTPEELAVHFQEIVQPITRILVDDCQLSIHVSSGVVLKRLWCTSPHVKYLGSVPEISLGEIFEGQTFLAELMLPPLKQKGEFDIGKVEVTYNVPIKKIVSGKSQVDLTTKVLPNSQNLPVNTRVMNVLEKVIASSSSQTQRL